MAQRFYRLDLSKTDFPLLSEEQGRTVIGSSKEEIAAKDNRPQVAYCHNVMPTRRGLDSIGFTSEIAAIAPAVTNMEDARVIFGDAESRIHMAWDDLGAVYVLLPGSTIWLALPPTTPATGGVGFSIDDVTTGTVNGVTYIFYKGISAFIFNEITNELDAVTLTGLSTADVLGITGSYGYLVAVTKTAIAWSSTISPIDFVPSQITGAGGGNVTGIGGSIKFALANSLGILIYTDTNVVAATYTGNVQYPFKFREVGDSKGGLSLDTIAYEANTVAQFAYTKAGMQAVTSQRAAMLLPETTDFLAGKRFEDYDELTDIFTLTDLTTTMKKKVKFIASRYVVISYGITSFTHALVYDTALEKLGKLKVTHADCFEYVGDQTEVSKESIAFLLNTGEVKLVDFSSVDASDSVLIFGKLQFTRSRLITLQELQVENIKTGSTVAVSTRASLDGKTTTTIAGTESYSAESIRKYAFHNTAVNHSLMFVGKFNLVSVLVAYTIHGRR